MRGSRWESLTVKELSFQKSIQKQSDPSFFLTSTTALHHGLLLGQITPASSIIFRCAHTSSSCGDGIQRNLSLNGGVLGSLRTILCLAALVRPMSPFSNEKMSWYSFNRLRLSLLDPWAMPLDLSGPIFPGAGPVSWPQ